MRLEIAAGVRPALEKRKRWWRAHRDKAPDLFEREFEEAVAQIQQAPESFPIYSSKGSHSVRRCLMPKTKCHLYIEIHAEDDAVWIVAAGGGQQRRTPPATRPR